MITDKDIGKLIVQVSADGRRGFYGQLVEYTDRPQALILMDNGEKVWIHADKLEEATDSDCRENLNEIFDSIRLRDI